QAAGVEAATVTASSSAAGAWPDLHQRSRTTSAPVVGDLSSNTFKSPATAISRVASRATARPSAPGASLSPGGAATPAALRPAAPAPAVISVMVERPRFVSIREHPDAELLDGVLILRVDVPLLFYNAGRLRRTIESLMRAELRRWKARRALEDAERDAAELADRLARDDVAAADDDGRLDALRGRAAVESRNSETADQGGNAIGAAAAGVGTRIFRPTHQYDPEATVTSRDLFLATGGVHSYHAATGHVGTGSTAATTTAAAAAATPAARPAALAAPPRSMEQLDEIVVASAAAPDVAGSYADDAHLAGEAPARGYGLRATMAAWFSGAAPARPATRRPTMAALPSDAAAAAAASAAEHTYDPEATFMSDMFSPSTLEELREAAAAAATGRQSHTAVGSGWRTWAARAFHAPDGRGRSRRPLGVGLYGRDEDTAIVPLPVVARRRRRGAAAAAAAAVAAAAVAAATAESEVEVERAVHTIVIDLSHCFDVDSAGALVLRSVCEALAASGVRVCVAGALAFHARLLDRAGFAPLLRGNVFPDVEAAVADVEADLDCAVWRDLDGYVTTREDRWGPPDAAPWSP
ncbi:hypothetical protein HK405_013218, partial [Cladochytrium tenue]